jgi:hypothetical protein
MKLKDLFAPKETEAPMTDATYGVEIYDGATAKCYLGNDEKLWDWANTPVTVEFNESGLAEVPLPEGYFLHEDEAGDVTLIEGYPTLGEINPSNSVTALVSEKSARDDMAYILIHSMLEVTYKQFKAAKLPNERVMRSTSF